MRVTRELVDRLCNIQYVGPTGMYKGAVYLMKIAWVSIDETRFTADVKKYNGNDYPVREVLQLFPSNLYVVLEVRPLPSVLRSTV